MTSAYRREAIVGHFFDRTTGRTWKWVLPDPPPPTILVPEWTGRPRIGLPDPMSEQMVEVYFHRLYFETEALDNQPHVVYISQRGTKGARTL